jgi:hypothetical protein
LVSGGTGSEFGVGDSFFSAHFQLFNRKIRKKIGKAIG